MLPGHFEAYASQTAVPRLVLLFENGLSTPFIGCRMRAHSCKSLAKNLCLVLSEECPDDNGLDIRDFTVFISYPTCSSAFCHRFCFSGCS